MTNEEKAREIAKESKYLSDFPHDEKSVEYGAITMAEWKEKQMIEMACKWAIALMEASGNYDAYDTQENLRDLKQTMKNETESN